MRHPEPNRLADKVPWLLLRKPGHSAGRSSPGGLLGFLGGSPIHLVCRRRANRGYRVGARLMGYVKGAIALDIMRDLGGCRFTTSRRLSGHSRGASRQETLSCPTHLSKPHRTAPPSSDRV